MRQAIKVASLLFVISVVLGYLGLSVHGIYAEIQPPIQVQATPPQFKPAPLPPVPYQHAKPAKPKKAKPAPSTPTPEDRYMVCPVQDPCRQRMVVFI